jgi:hypothetical protein
LAILLSGGIEVMVIRKKANEGANENALLQSGIFYQSDAPGLKFNAAVYYSATITIRPNGGFI